MAVAEHETRQFTLSRSPQGTSMSQTSVADVQSTELLSSVVEARTFTPELIGKRHDTDSGTEFTTPTTKRVQDDSKVPTTVISSPQENTAPDRDDCDADGEVDRDSDLKSRWLKRRYGVLYGYVYGNSQNSKLSDVSKAEKCTNYCCQAYDFCCKYPYENPTIAPTKSRTLGFKSVVDTVCSDVFTASLIGSIVRECVIYFEVLLMLALWSNVLAGFILNDHNQLEDNVFRICQLGLSTVGVFLTILDLIHHWCRYCCKICIECYKNKKNHSHLTADCKRMLCSQIGCGYEIVDIIRFFVTPAITYPLLLLSMFELLSQLVLFRTDATTLISFLLSIVIQFSLVYLVRMFIFVGTIYSVQKVRTGGKSQRDLTNGSTFHQYFVANAFGHMFVELLLIATIGVRFYYDYQVFWNNVGVQRPTVFLPTAQLWCMMVFGYFAAPIGIMLFLLSHYYWFQRFFIKFFVDAHDVLKETTNKDIAFTDASSELNKASSIRKFMYPFLSPTISLLCIAYCILLLGFAVCALLQSPPSASFGIIGFYAAATVITISVNLYASAIAFVWISVFVVITVVIVNVIIAFVYLVFSGWIVVILCVGCCVFLSSSSSSSSHQRRKNQNNRDKMNQDKLRQHK